MSDGNADIGFEAKVAGVIAALGDNISDLQAESIVSLAQLVRHGGTIDIHVRRGGKDHQFEGDWLPWLFRP
jgi:dihydroorotase-like cyclic amidohydrolase